MPGCCPMSTFAPLIAVLVSASVLVRLVNAEGVDATNHTSICVTTQEEIAALLVNQDQLENGVEGGKLVTNDCSELVAADVMNYRSDEDQAAICSNSCFSALNEKYKALLDNDCFTEEAEGDADEAASARLQAAAYQFACQTRADGKYCVSLLGKLVEEAGTSYNLCNDIVSKLGCCFQSYKQYMLLGTAASIAAMNEAQTSCTSSGLSGLDQLCPCGVNFAYNIHAFSDTTFCSSAPFLRAPAALLVIAIALVVSVIT